MAREKIVYGLKYAWTIVVSVLLAFVCYFVFDIVMTVFVNKIFDTDLKSDWSEISEDIRQHFRKKLG